MSSIEELSKALEENALELKIAIQQERWDAALDFAKKIRSESEELVCFLREARGGITSLDEVLPEVKLRIIFEQGGLLGAKTWLDRSAGPLWNGKTPAEVFVSVEAQRQYLDDTCQIWIRQHLEEFRAQQSAPDAAGHKT